MMRNPLQELVDQGQSVWLDYLSRDLIRSGQLEEMIATDGLRGITSNPTIFPRGHLRQRYLRRGDRVALRQRPGRRGDLRDAGDRGHPGGVRHPAAGLRVDAGPGRLREPRSLAAPGARHGRDGGGRAAAGGPGRLPQPDDQGAGHARGLPAIETLLGEGINVNITLIFAQEVYRAVAESYLNALEARAARGESLDAVASVASTFVSRIDTAVDDQLEALAASRPDAAKEARDLLGQAAIANSKVCYRIFEEVFGSERFQRLAARGARRQRPLWASTSTKNPAYSPTRYVDELIGPDTVNTMPENTMTAFRDTGEVQETVRADMDFWDEVLERLQRLGIDLDAVMDQLEDEGVQKFVDSYDELLADLDAKAAALRA